MEGYEELFVVSQNTQNSFLGMMELIVCLELD